ncbi:hypothetical protein OAS88_05060 [Planktomarina temperata]|nr:hypothetical protein [Planktomarina temperata]MDC1094976.1 hypothetical protein [Planktomarina temperata]
MSAHQGGGYGSRIEGYSNPFLRAFLQIVYPPAPFFNIINQAEKQKIRSNIFGNTGDLNVLDIGSGLTKGPGAWLTLLRKKRPCTLLNTWIDDTDLDQLHKDADIQQL